MPVLIRLGHARPHALPGTASCAGDQLVFACPCGGGHVFSLPAALVTGTLERLDLTLIHAPVLTVPGCGWQGSLAGGVFRHLTEGPPRTYTLDQLEAFQ
ncbi:hypothetical protein [uncultured Deinococcus sp.]|uniref:hypothetical protein n=1 Tax=uncultured Deinococcus sp. TaxID=158789 RepID=UPI0025D694C2|nr:hypothetical protein [uncultured Deinococcus sp.]